ncbi:hypothetical protein TNCV_4477741 [Trichonephila clavipes]|nr:hypothetical protein TNCV_4477741 [Trichonephila clavipes]
MKMIIKVIINGSEMDDDEDQGVIFDFSAPTQQGMHTNKFNPVSFDFQESQYSKYTHTKPSPTPSLAEDENDEPPPKRSYDLYSKSSSL